MWGDEGSMSGKKLHSHSFQQYPSPQTFNYQVLSKTDTICFFLKHFNTCTGDSRWLEFPRDRGKNSRDQEIEFSRVQNFQG